MSVRILEGVADGTTPAAAMYDGVTGQMFGPIFEGTDAPDDIEAFLSWLHDIDLYPLAEKIGLTPEQLPSRDPSDARAWADGPLGTLIVWWKKNRVLSPSPE